MKDFEEFKATLDDDTLTDIRKRAYETAMEKADVEKADTEDKIAVIFQQVRITSELMTIDLLERYHKWLRE